MSLSLIKVLFRSTITQISHQIFDADILSDLRNLQEEGTAFRIHGLPLESMRRSSVYVATELSSHLTSQILMLYYVLTYQDCLLSNMKSLGKAVTSVRYVGSVKADKICSILIFTLKSSWVTVFFFLHVKWCQLKCMHVL